MAAAEAKVIGWGGIQIASQAAGVSRRAGVQELARSIHDERRIATLRCQAIGFNEEGAEER
jgi:hypothetical protein